MAKPIYSSRSRWRRSTPTSSAISRTCSGHLSEGIRLKTWTVKPEAHQRPFSLGTWLEETDALRTRHEAKRLPTVGIGTIVFTNVDVLLRDVGIDLTGYVEFNEGK